MKILIADDHALFREGMRHVLNDLAEHIDILEAPDCERALQHAAKHADLDLVLLDLNMPDKNGFAALDMFTEQYPALPVVILSASNQRSDIQRALELGAMGFISKDATGNVMLNALRIVLSGEVYIPPALVQHSATQARRSSEPALTPRQLDVLALLVEGHSNKKIGSHLGLAEGTVKMHVTAILKELNVSNRTQAAMAVEKMGLQLPLVSSH
jgi:DNA-binding NarL/FixJ family response regulator